MHRVPRRRLLAAILASMALVAIAIPPIAGVASAASTSTTCSTLEGGNSECFLDISAPESVLTGVPFTVTVGVYADSDRSVLAKSDPCASKVLVTLDVDPSESLSFSSTQSVNASAAVATFYVTIPAGNTNDGLYNLFAHVGPVDDLAPASTTSCDSYFYGSNSADVTAITIPATQPIAPCPDNVTCVQTFSGSGSAATLIADTGTFTDAHFEGFTTGAGCETSGPADPNGVLTFGYSGSDPKTIVLALSSELVTKGIAQFNICWRSTNPFTQLGGTPAPVVGGLFTGYLPACKKNDAGPCVLFKKSNQHNVAFFGILAPPSDPKTYPK